MYINGTKQVVDTRNQVEYTLSGPISGMYLIQGAGETKFVTPAQLRKYFTFRDKPITVFNSHTDGNGHGFLIRKKFIQLLKEIDDTIEILYDSNSKTDYYRYSGGQYFLMTTWSKPSFWIYINPDNLSPVRKKYVTRRTGSEGSSRCLTAQFRITKITPDTIALMRGIIIDSVFVNRRQV